MLLPKKVKHRKWFNPKIKGNATSGATIAFGSYALKALDARWISSRQIEAARRAMTRYMQRGGKVWIRIFPNRPVTRKGSEVPMGSGKGTVDHYVAHVKPGKIIFEMEGVSEEIAREAMRLASHKLSCRTKFIIKDNK